MKTEWVKEIPGATGKGNHGSKYDSLITEVLKTQRIAKLSCSSLKERKGTYSTLYQLCMRRQYTILLSARGNDIYISPKIREKGEKP